MKNCELNVKHIYDNLYEIIYICEYTKELIFFHTFFAE